MKKNSTPQPTSVRRSPSEGGFFTFGISIALLALMAGVFLLALGEFVAANPSKSGGNAVPAHSSGLTASGAPLSGQLTGQRFARVTPQGVIIENLLTSERQRLTLVAPGRRAPGPLGTTLWEVDDLNAIAAGVSIDSNDVWGGWTLQGARLSAYPITGNGTPDFEFSSFGNGNSGVASARGADRMAYMESNDAGNDFRIHGFQVHQWRNTGLVVSVSC